MFVNAFLNFQVLRHKNHDFSNRKKNNQSIIFDSTYIFYYSSIICQEFDSIIYTVIKMFIINAVHT